MYNDPVFATFADNDLHFLCGFSYIGNRVAFWFIWHNPRCTRSYFFNSAFEKFKHTCPDNPIKLLWVIWGTLHLRAKIKLGPIIQTPSEFHSFVSLLRCSLPRSSKKKKYRTSHCVFYVYALKLFWIFFEFSAGWPQST